MTQDTFKSGHMKLQYLSFTYIDYLLYEMLCKIRNKIRAFTSIVTIFALICLSYSLLFYQFGLCDILPYDMCGIVHVKLLTI